MWWTRSQATSGRASSADRELVGATWRELRAEVTAALAGSGIANAENEARFMTEAASGASTAEWLEIAGAAAPWRAESRLRSMCARRLAGEPLQYALGSWSFRGLDLMVDARVLIPRPETEWLVEVALETAVGIGLRRVPRRPALDGPVRAHVADLGTGSGAIALALESALPEVEVWATDASVDALAVASANIAGCAATRVRLAEGGWYDALPRDLRGRISLIVSNPPYVAESEIAALPSEVIDHEPRRALVAGPTGLEALSAVIEGAAEWMAERSALVCEIAPPQAPAVVALVESAGFVAPVVVDDLAGRPRVLVATRG
jgi:release factor glutamine methyltransferase